MIDGRAGLCHTAEACAVFEALAGVDTHDRESQLRLHLVEDRFARPGRHSCDAALDDTADRVSVAPVGLNRLSELVRVGLCAHLHQPCLHGNTALSQLLFGDTAGNDTRRCLTGTGSAAATPVTDAVFLLIDLVGMSGPVSMSEPFVVLRSCVFIPDDECNRSA